MVSADSQISVPATVVVAEDGEEAAVSSPDSVQFVRIVPGRKESHPPAPPAKHEHASLQFSQTPRSNALNANPPHWLDTSDDASRSPMALPPQERHTAESEASGDSGADDTPKAGKGATVRIFGRLKGRGLSDVTHPQANEHLQKLVPQDTFCEYGYHILVKLDPSDTGNAINVAMQDPEMRVMELGDYLAEAGSSRRAFEKAAMKTSRKAGGTSAITAATSGTSSLAVHRKRNASSSKGASGSLSNPAKLKTSNSRAPPPPELHEALLYMGAHCYRPDCKQKLAMKTGSGKAYCPKSRDAPGAEEWEYDKDLVHFHDYQDSKRLVTLESTWLPEC